MTGSWESVVGSEIGIGADVTVPHEGRRIDGVIDAFWIRSPKLRAFETEVQVRVKVADEHGTWWVGPHTLVERAP